VHEWNSSNNCGIVFGATNPEELEENIPGFKNLPVLLPGVGSQGGSLEEVVKIFQSNHNNNYIINISRALIYEDSSESFAFTAFEKLKEYNSIIKKITAEF
jgi:orotidine-5'-phosphate decarboxylase